MNLQAILDAIKTYWPFVLELVGAFAILATITANKVDNKVINVILKAINLLGANFGNSKNKDE